MKQKPGADVLNKKVWEPLYLLLLQSEEFMLSVSVKMKLL